MTTAYKHAIKVILLTHFYEHVIKCQCERYYTKMVTCEKRSLMGNLYSFINTFPF